MVQSGTAKNASGHFIFLGRGDIMNKYAISEAKLVNSHGDIAGSKAWLNNNGYMTDYSWT